MPSATRRRPSPSSKPPPLKSKKTPAALKELGSDEELPPSRKRFKFQDASTATIFVGPRRSAFVAHIDLLCENSEYFQAALLGQFAESMKKEVTLTDQDADSFEYFVQWLYKSSLKDAQLTTDTGPQKVAVKWATVTEIYVLAQYLQVPKLCNNLVDMIRSHMRPSLLPYRRSFTLPEPHAINLVYSKMPHDSSLRKLIVSVFLWEKDEGMWNDAKERKDWLRKLPVDFCHDLLIATSRNEVKKVKCRIREAGRQV